MSAFNFIAAGYCIGCGYSVLVSSGVRRGGFSALFCFVMAIINIALGAWQ